MYIKDLEDGLVMEDLQMDTQHVCYNDEKKMCVGEKRDAEGMYVYTWGK